MWKEEQERINKALNDFLVMKRNAAHYLGPVHDFYYDNLREYVMRGGKRLRPLAVVTAYKAVAGEPKTEFLYRASCSFEILHNGSLLHDDLIDHDETRRNGPTFHALYRDWLKEKAEAGQEKADDFGMTMAILGGDSLINLGAETITTSQLSGDVAAKCHTYFQQGFSEIVEGVLLEMNMVLSDNVSSETYLEMVRLKTAALFEKALLMGAAMANANESQLEAFSEFGVKIGQAFQMQDDILGSFGDEEETGKSASGDIREGKRTMLLIKALELANPEQKQVLTDLVGKEDMTDEEVEKVRDVFRESGALKSTEKIMNKLLEEGQDALRKAKPPLKSQYLDFMLNLSRFLTSRAF